MFQKLYWLITLVVLLVVAGGFDENACYDCDGN